MRSVFLARTGFALAAAAAILASGAGAGCAQDLEVGVKGGSVRANMRTSYDVDCEPGEPCATGTAGGGQRVAGGGGLFARVPISRLLSVQVEALWTPKGYAVSSPSISVDYMEIPLLLRIDRPRTVEAPVQPFGYVGLAPAFLTRCSFHGTYVASPFGVPRTYEAGCGEPDPMGRTEEVRPFDLGWLVGAGIAVRFPVGHLDLEIRGGSSLLDVEPSEGRTLHRVWAVLAGYAVPLF